LVYFAVSDPWRWMNWMNRCCCSSARSAAIVIHLLKACSRIMMAARARWAKGAVDRMSHETLEIGLVHGDEGGRVELEVVVEATMQADAQIWTLMHVASRPREFVGAIVQTGHVGTSERRVDKEELRASCWPCPMTSSPKPLPFATMRIEWLVLHCPRRSCPWALHVQLVRHQRGLRATQKLANGNAAR